MTEHAHRFRFEPKGEEESFFAMANTHVPVFVRVLSGTDDEGGAIEASVVPPPSESESDPPREANRAGPASRS